MLLALVLHRSLSLFVYYFSVSYHRQYEYGKGILESIFLLSKKSKLVKKQMLLALVLHMDHYLSTIFQSGAINNMDFTPKPSVSGCGLINLSLLQFYGCLTNKKKFK